MPNSTDPATTTKTANSVTIQTGSVCKINSPQELHWFHMVQTQQPQKETSNSPAIQTGLVCKLKSP